MDKKENVTLELEEKNSEEKELGMGWHEFIVFCLGCRGWLGIISAIITVVAACLALELSAILCGLLALGVSVFALVTQKQLDELCSGAIKFLLGFYVLQFAMNVIDSLIAFGIRPSSGFDVKDIIADAIAMVIMLLINIPYYVRRKDMFVN